MAPAPKATSKAKANPATAPAAPPAAAAGASAENDTAEAAAGASTVDIVKTAGGKPDQQHHYAQLDAIKKNIAKTQAELDNVRSILNGTGPSKDTPEGKRREALRAELDEIRNKQAGSKGSRGKVLDQIKALQDSSAKRIKDLNATKSKLQFKSAAEVDAQIARLNSQIESGSMKLVDERRAINEISNLRKAKKTYDTLAAQQASIDADRKQVDELRKTLDDPESRALSKRYDEIKAELDEISKGTEKQAGSRSKLLDQRTALQKRLTELNQNKRDRIAAYRAENEKFHARVQAEREKRNERLRAERQAEADAKRKEHEQQMREDAALPAFAKEIEDCDVLLNYFSTKAGLTTEASTTSSSANAAAAGSGRLGKTLEIRRVEPEGEGEAPKGMRVAKKKGEENEDDFFFSGKKGKGKGGNARASGGAAGKQPAPAEDDASSRAGGSTLHVPLGHLSALLALSIPAPTSTTDLPRVIDNLKLKRSYFVANQERVTKENIAKVEKLLGKASISDGGAEAKEGNAANGVADKATAASGDAVEDADEKAAEAKSAAASKDTEAESTKQNGKTAAADEDDDDDDDDE